MPAQPKGLGLWEGVGLVSSNMIGVGVFLSAGFMAQQLGPTLILAAWGLGALLALCGAKAYAAVAQVVPRSGGEYRFLSDLLHPAIGYIAGWGSLLVGFAAPIAAEALAAGNFANTLWPVIQPQSFAITVIGLLTLLHSSGWSSSRWTQDGLAALKVLVVIGFIAVGLATGSSHWPKWEPPIRSDHFPTEAFVASLFYIAFAFSGWNAAVYAAEEFRHPQRDVPRAMLIGTAAVALLYLATNWIFVANLSPIEASVVFEYDAKRVTLGHLVAVQLIGVGGAKVMSAIMIVLFWSAISAMTFVGPRIYAAMAGDGYLPKIFAGKSGKPPIASALLQNGLATVIVLTHGLRQVLENVGAILTLFAALTAISVFRIRWLRRSPTPSSVSLTAAAIYTVCAAWMLYFGFKGSPTLLIWVGTVTGIALTAYAITVVVHRPKSAKTETRLE